MKFTRLSIRLKVLIAFSSILLVLLILGSFAIGGLITLKRIHKQSQSISNLTLEIHKIQQASINYFESGESEQPNVITDTQRSTLFEAIDHLKSLSINDFGNENTERLEQLIAHKNKLPKEITAKELRHLSDEAFSVVSALESTRAEKTEQLQSRILTIMLLCIIVSALFAWAWVIILPRTLHAQIKQVAQIAKGIAKGDLSKEFDAAGQDEIAELTLALREMVMRLREMISKTTRIANNIATASQQISTTSQQLSQGASEQSVSVEEISTTVEEMTINVEQSRENTFLTEQIAKNALKGIYEVNEQSRKAVLANEDITKKISVINDISFQTNILALNAAVEAARLGEMGRGFGVVASEVRKLADNSKKASTEISGLTTNGLSITKESNEKLTKMLPEIEKTSLLLQEVSAASSEQANGVAQINNAIQTLNLVTQQNAAASEELAANAEEMASQALSLKESMGYFNVVPTHGTHAPQQGKAHGNNPAKAAPGTGSFWSSLLRK